MSAASPASSIPLPMARVPRRVRGMTQPPRIRPIVRKAVHAMVHEGLSAPDAAAAVGIHPSALYQSLGTPQVKALLEAEMDVLRESKRPRALHRIDDLGEKAESEAVRLAANKYLESKGNTERGATVNVQINNQQPGYVLAIDPRYLDTAGDEQQPARLMTLDAKPLPGKADVPRR